MTNGNLGRIIEAINELTVAQSDLIDEADSMKVEVRETEARLGDLGIFVEASIVVQGGELQWREWGKNRAWKIIYSPDDGDPRPVLDTNLLLRVALRERIPDLVRAITARLKEEPL